MGQSAHPPSFLPMISLARLSPSPSTRYGEIVNINLVRDKKSGQSKGFCFLGYENQRSTVLAVDNFNGIKVCVCVLVLTAKLHDMTLPMKCTCRLHLIYYHACIIIKFYMNEV